MIRRPAPRRARLAFLALVALVLAPAAPGAEITMVESGFLATTLSGDTSKQIELGVGPDTCLYYGTFDGLKRRCSPNGPETVCDASLTFPAGIAFSTGGAFGNAMYVADYGLGDVFKSPGCAAATLFADLIAPGALAFPPAGSPYGGDLFACEAFDGPIYRISSTGAVSEWLALETVYLRFGPGGAWGTGLYATDMSDFENGKIVKISPTKVVTPLADGFLVPEGFDWGFDGDMFATDPTLGEVYRIKPNGTTTVFATLIGAADVAYRPGEQALYVVSNQGGIYRVARQSAVDVPDAAPDAAGIVVTPNPARGACALRFTLPLGGRVRAQVWDAAGRLVRRLGDAWRPAGVQSIGWDGRDEGGRAAAPGIYFARIEWPGAVLRAPVAITR